MSTNEAMRVAAPAVTRPARRSAPARFLRSELGLVFRRRRNLAMLAVLACAPILLGLAIKASSPGPDEGGPGFINQVSQNGLFLAFTSLIVTLPLFLPLAVSVVCGEAIAGEANTGTLRNLLVVPVGRTRLLAVKYASAVAYSLACTLTVAAFGVAIGLMLFPGGSVTLLSGTSIPFAEALVRVLLVALYVAGMLCAVAAIGIFISTLTEVPLAAMAAASILVIICEILDSVPQLSAIHSYLFTHYWLTFGDLLRSPVQWHDMSVGLMAQGIYVAVFLSLAWARFTTRDVSS